MKKKLYFIASIYDPIFVFLIQYLLDLNRDYEITIVCNLNDTIFPKFSNFHYKHINISRQPDFFNDFKEFLYLFFFFITNRPFKIVSITPKVGLIVTIISKILFIKNLHFITGQVWQNKSNPLSKNMLKILDKITGRLSNKIIVDSHPQYKFLKDNKIINDQSIYFNSVSGINKNKFQKKKIFKSSFLKKNNLTKDSFGLIYVGRINHDKGISDLIDTYLKLKKKLLQKVFLIIVGEDEVNYFNNFSKNFLKVKNIFLIKKNNNINYYLNLCSLFVTFSNREGFCQSIIEANSVGLPAIAKNLYNLSDTILNNKTGYLVNNNNNFYKLILKLYLDKSLYNKFSHNAYQRIKLEFNQEIFIKKFRSYLLND